MLIHFFSRLYKNHLFRGRNAGYAWLEEDGRYLQLVIVMFIHIIISSSSYHGRCPYDGRVWREAGSDVHLEQMLVCSFLLLCNWSTKFT